MNDRDITGLLVEQHIPWAQGIAAKAKRRLPASVDIADLEQIAMIALWRCAQAYRDDYQLAGYDQPVPFCGYAYRRIYFACLMAFRRRQYADGVHAQIPASAPDESLDLEPAAEQRQAKQRLWRNRITHWPAKQRRLFQLVYRRGYGIAEAAAELQISPRYATQLHVTGLAKLRVSLERSGISRTADLVTA